MVVTAEIQMMIYSNRWHHAWLELYAIGLGWFRIKNIFLAQITCYFLLFSRFTVSALLLLLYLVIAVPAKAAFCRKRQ